MDRLSVILALVWVALGGGAWGAQAPDNPMLSEQNRRDIMEAQTVAQGKCFREIYRDSNAYVQCLRDLRRKYVKSPYGLIGIEYFGFVGALAYTRVSHQGAQQIASEFLPHFRSSQKMLRISDGDLCATLPGDCKVRIAQTHELEKTPVEAPRMRVMCQAGMCRIVPEPAVVARHR